MTGKSKNHSSLFFIKGLFLAIAVCGLVLSGCGDDSGSSRSSGGAAECWPGLGECTGSEMCVNRRCVPFQGRRFRFTMMEGQFPEAKSYYVRVRYRGDTLLMETPTTTSTRTPSWYESTIVTVNGRSDWWEIEVRSEGFFFDSSEFSCEWEFDPAGFEVDGVWTCGVASDHIKWELEAL